MKVGGASGVVEQVLVVLDVEQRSGQVLNISEVGDIVVEHSQGAVVAVPGYRAGVGQRIFQEHRGGAVDVHDAVAGDGQRPPGNDAVVPIKGAGDDIGSGQCRAGNGQVCDGAALKCRSQIHRATRQ